MGTSQVNMRWDSELLERVDARCEAKGRTRSDWVQAACEFVLEQIEAPTVTDRATLRMRIEPIAGNTTGPFAQQIAEREAGRADRKAVYDAKTEADLLGPGYAAKQAYP